MKEVSLLNENWEVLQTLFPANWKSLAKETGAMVRKLRTFESEDAVMRTLLIHIARGYSLRETVVKAKLAGISDVSDVALLKRLRLSETWLKELCRGLFKERGLAELKANGNIRMRLVDATNVKEPGKTGSLWRIHYSLSLPDLQCDYFHLTPTKGCGTGETYKQFPVEKGDCIIGDRAYSTAAGIEFLEHAGAHSLVRVNTLTLPFYLETGKPVDLLARLKKVNEPGQISEWPVCVKRSDGSFLRGRACVVRKNELAIEQATKKLRRNACRKQTRTQPETFEFAKYIIVFTTLPSNQYCSREILEWYRLRWQIELIFKRLKSLAGLGHLPKHDDASSRAWLYGKLLVGLLTEKLIDYSSNISPWGYCLGGE